MNSLSPHLRNWTLALSLLVAGIWLLRGGKAEQAKVDGRTEVVLWHFWGGADLEVVRDVVARFNAAQAEYRVREIAMPGNNLRAKLFLSAAGGRPPDLINIDDPVVADWYELGLLRSVDEIVGQPGAQEISAKLFPAARQLSSYSDRLVGICNGLDVRALYFNRTFLQQQGWAVPQTLEELDQLNDRVRDLGLSQPRFAFLPTPRRAIFFVNLFGGAVWDFSADRPQLDAPASVAALTWLQEYSRRYGAGDVAAYRQSDQSLPGKVFPLLPQADDQQVGRYVFSLDGQWRVRDLQAFRKQRATRGVNSPEFDVTPLPPPSSALKTSSTEPGGWVNGNVFVFPRGARASAGAVAFAKFWIGLDNAQAAAEIAIAGGWIPVAPAVVSEAKYQDALAADPIFRRFVQLASSSQLQPTPVVRGAGYLQRLLESTAERVASDPSLSPEQELKAANRQLEDYLQSLSSSRTSTAGKRGEQ
jgi:multiple sugar transport system substrate-binding protein